MDPIIRRRRQPTPRPPPSPAEAAPVTPTPGGDGPLAEAIRHAHALRRQGVKDGEAAITAADAYGVNPMAVAGRMSESAIRYVREHAGRRAS